MAKNNAQRPTTATNRAPFYGVLIAIALIGAGSILYFKNSKPSAPASNPEYEALRQQYANAGPPQPYVHGKPDAPVVIEEFADYECPSCGRFATITEPDVRSRIVDAGLAVYKFYDFPLPMHRNSPGASMAAACADEQGKFWEMHDGLFSSQDQWGLGPTEREVVDDPRPVFLNIAKGLGLNTTQWEQCYDSGKYKTRIAANAAEAVRRNVDQTPTFYVNGVKSAGALSYDQLKKLVDDASKKGPMSAADSAMGNLIKH